MARLSYLDREYVSKIKGLNDWARLSLARAHDIAKRNFKDEGRKQNYLLEFYAGLKATLDKDPAKVGKWAAAVIEGFEKSEDEELMRKVA